MRKFKSSDPTKDTGDFDKLLGEIFPQEVPIGFVKGVRVIYNDDSSKDLTQEEIKGVSPNVGVVNYSEIAKIWDNTKHVEIYLDIEKLKRVVETNVSRILNKD